MIWTSNDGPWYLHEECQEPIHSFFGLTYANYLVLHRTFLQSMPQAWQHQFVKLLEELNQAFDHVDQPYGYRVNAVDEGGRFTRDTVPHYDRGRARVEPYGG